ncbi:MAG: aminoglycoside phosphotransferase family protein [Myxococcota bacterium]
MFPSVATPEDFDALDLDDAAFLLAVFWLVQRISAARPGEEGVKRFSAGSLPVFAVGAEQVLKLYPPCFVEEGAHEARWLKALEGSLPIPTPRLLGEGQDEGSGWRWVLMTRLSGRPADVCWAEIPRKQQLRLSVELGEALSVLHSLSFPTSLALFDWDDFIAEQHRTATTRQQGRGLGAHWCDQIEGFLNTAPPADGPHVPLHTEIMRQHLFVKEVSGRWALCGVLDFEPATVGAPGYEFASVGLFWSCGDAALLRAVMHGYGMIDGRAGKDFSQALMRWALLHRYSHLPWYLKRMPPKPTSQTLSTLSMQWFGLEVQD